METAGQTVIDHPLAKKAKVEESLASNSSQGKPASRKTLVKVLKFEPKQETTPMGNIESESEEEEEEENKEQE